MLCIPITIDCPAFFISSADAKEPVVFNKKFIDNEHITKPTNPEKAATPLSPFAKPKGIAIANIIGKLENAKEPIVAINSNKTLIERIFKNGSISAVTELEKELPTPSIIPHAANNETGSINVFPKP